MDCRKLGVQPHVPRRPPCRGVRVRCSVGPSSGCRADEADPETKCMCATVRTRRQGHSGEQGRHGSDLGSSESPSRGSSAMWVKS